MFSNAREWLPLAGKNRQALCSSPTLVGPNVRSGVLNINLLWLG